MSFRTGYESLGLGNFMQYSQVEYMCQEGVKLYDLGQDIEYKYRWGETRFATKALFLQ